MEMCGKMERGIGEKMVRFDSNAKMKYERDAEIRATADRCCMNKKEREKKNWMRIARVLREEGTTIYLSIYISSFYSLREAASIMFYVFFSLWLCDCYKSRLSLSLALSFFLSQQDPRLFICTRGIYWMRTE